MVHFLKNKKFWLAILIAYVFVFIFEFVYHSILMMPAYEATSELWRGKEAVGNYMAFGIIGNIIALIALAYLFRWCCKGRCPKKAIKFAVVLAVLKSALWIGMYMYLAITPIILIGWIIAEFILLIGISLIYAWLLPTCDSGEACEVAKK